VTAAPSASFICGKLLRETRCRRSPTFSANQDDSLCAVDAAILRIDSRSEDQQRNERGTRNDRTTRRQSRFAGDGSSHNFVSLRLPLSVTSSR